MKLELSPSRQRHVALAVLVLCALIVVFWIIMPLWHSSALHGERVAMLRKQAYAMAALSEAAPKLEAEVQKLAARPDLALLTYSAAQPALAVAQLQGQLSQICTAARAQVTSSQPMPDVKTGALNKISVQTTLEVDIKGLVETLHAIAAARPLLRIEKLTLRDPDGDWSVAPQAVQPNKLQVDIVVSAYMRVS